jgi:Flp pilus assembly protein TadG
MVETAVVIPVVLMLIIGTFIIGQGIYYYQKVATLAREGARQASVHGTQYAADTGNTAWTATDIYTNAIQPMAVGLNTSPSFLTYSVNWNTTNSPTTYNPNSTPPGAPIQNTVSVTVHYKWTPGLYITGTLDLTSTSVMPMSY